MRFTDQIFSWSKAPLDHSGTVKGLNLSVNHLLKGMTASAGQGCYLKA